MSADPTKQTQGQTRRRPSSWVIAPSRRSTGALLAEMVFDLADLAAIRRWQPAAASRDVLPHTSTRGPDSSQGVSIPLAGRRLGSFGSGPRRAGCHSPLRRLRAALQGWVIGPALRTKIRLRSGGASDVTALSEPAIFVANHASHLDILAVLAALPSVQRDDTAVAVPGESLIRSRSQAAVAALMLNTFQQPAGEYATAAQKLHAGNHVIVFGEGTRSLDGFAGPFSTDAARLAIQSGRSVVPVGIRGSYAAMPPGQSWPTRGRPRVSVRFGTAMQASASEQAELFTDRIRTEVCRLIAEDRTSWWRAQSDPCAGAGSRAPVGNWQRRWQQSHPAEPGGLPHRPRIWRR